jgi:selenide,water dikinase
MEFPKDENLIVGLDKADDAGVYKLNHDLAMIQTVDFFTPVVDNPYNFGQIAAANALSDIYAMGGTPKTAMNLVAFPANDMDIAILREIIQGGLDKMNEAEVVLVGGHSVEDKELKYGLSVTGFVHPDHILTKRDLRLGDQLILTKPLGIGIITTAIKGGLASEEIIENATRLMATLNRQAAEFMKAYPVHACTDITGFGLLGHLTEMVMDSKYSLQIHAHSIPILPEALDYAGMGLVPAGAFSNRDYYGYMVEIASSVDPLIQDVLFDPQTSGGLLISLDEQSAKDLLMVLKEKGVQEAALIGEVVSGLKHKIEVIQE